MNTNELDYELPAALIAQEPAPVRSESRLLVLDRATGGLTDSRFCRLGEFLRPGDCLVLNDTKVLAARFFARRRTGGRLEGLFLQEASAGTGRRRTEDRGQKTEDRWPSSEIRPPSSGLWEVLLKGARKVRPGESIHIEDRDRRDFCTARVTEKKPDGVCVLEVEAPADARAVLAEVGFPPLPPYVHRDHDLTQAASDLSRYQTVYARCPGAVAAPTAGLHFTDELMAQLQAAGISFAYVTLHVGAGTFKPIAAERVEEHEIHRERYRLDAANAAAINAARRQGGRIIAVGTTVTRVLETVAQNGAIAAGEGTTQLFITPGYEYKAADALITNFHLPRSTLLALVAAFAGLERMRAAYQHAIREQYRFYSYGDAMLIA
jgi:S-adenosylmethionine:tRNA ribosyltransferase-isomerase